MATRSGVGSARNEGVCQAMGDLLAFLDSDDLWLPGKLKAELDVLERFPMLRRSYRTVGSSWTGNSSGRLGSRKTVPSPRPEAEPGGSMIRPGCGRYPVMES